MKNNSQNTSPVYIDTSEAMDIAGVSRPTIITWIQVYGIGRKVVGRFKVDKNMLLKLLEGTLEERKEINGTKEKRK